MTWVTGRGIRAPDGFHFAENCTPGLEPGRDGLFGDLLWGRDADGNKVRSELPNAPTLHRIPVRFVLCR